MYFLFNLIQLFTSKKFRYSFCNLPLPSPVNVCLFREQVIYFSFFFSFKQSLLFDTHTVDSSSPGPKELVAFVFKLYKRDTLTVTTKTPEQLLFFLLVMSLECQLVWRFHKTIILLDSLSLTVYGIVL